MKKQMLITAVGLFLSIQSFCQTDTLPSPDKFVPVPTHIMGGVVKDLKSYDICKAEVEALNEQLDYANQYVEQMDSNRVILLSQIEYQSGLLEKRDNTIIDLHGKIQSLNKKAATNRTWIKALAVGLAVSVGTTILTKQ
jgi:hypothetical protein